jgi:hypothetical protein
MRIALTRPPLLAALALLAVAPTSHAGQINSAAECKVGMRVLTSDGHPGRISRVDRAWSYCYVLQDDTRKEVGYLYSLLQTEAPAGAKAESSGQLAIGSYTCWVGSQASASGLKVTGSSSYESDGKRGKYRLESSGKIVFENGPFAGFNAKLLPGRRVGMNLSGGSFFNLTCDPPR